MTQAPRGKGPAIEPVIRIDSEVTRCVRQHARLHPKTEVCGVLIGDNQNGAIEVRASIEGINAAQAGTHVTFTQDAWEAIYRVKDERYPDGRIVGWYHSHPGFGVFLSEHDMFIQENFFSSPGQIAWVYDPHTDEEGCFGWVDGKVHRIGALSIADNNGDGTERTPKHTESLQHDEVEDVETIRVSRPSRQPEPPRWARWAMTALSHLSVLVFGFAACYLLFPRMIALVPDAGSGRVLAVSPDFFTGKVTVEDGTDLFTSLLEKLRPGLSSSPNPLLPPLNETPTVPQSGPSGAPAAGVTKPQPQPATPAQPGSSAKPAPSRGHP